MTEPRQIHSVEQAIASSRALGAALGQMYAELTAFMPHEAALELCRTYMLAVLGWPKGGA